MHSNQPDWIRIWRMFKLVLYVLIPIVLLILPKDFFNEGQSICLSVLIFDTECFACGMTRASMHLIHLDLVKALEFNKMIVVVFPLLCYVWASSFWKDLKKYRKHYKSNVKVS